MSPKHADIDLLVKIKDHIQKGTYILVKHAIERQEERCIRLPDVLRVLEHGRHERDKDIFDLKRQAWKHAIRGKTINGIDLRIIIAFQNEMVIITVIKL
jgi:hypothetical protein